MVQGVEASYKTLLAPVNGRANRTSPLPQAGKYVDAGRARTSWLVWQLMGTNTARPWDVGEQHAKPPLRKVTQMPPPGKGTPLSPEELRTLVQWIDLGAPFEAEKGPASETRKLANTK